MTALRGLVLRAAEAMLRRWCGLRGHPDAALDIGARSLRLRCGRCGSVTPGWALEAPRYSMRKGGADAQDIIGRGEAGDGPAGSEARRPVLWWQPRRKAMDGGG